MVCRKRLVKDSRDDQAQASDEHEVATHFADGFMEALVGVEDATDEEAESQT